MGGLDEFSYFSHPEFSNRSTIKNITWIGDQKIAVGSNHGNVHIWDINTWGTENSEGTILRGHRSVVNQVVYCPLLGTIGSSGVEKSIRLWSEYPQEPFNGAVIKRSDENFGKKSTGQ